METNADRDLRLSPEKRKQAEKDDFNNQLIQQAIDDAKRDGPGIDVLSQKGQQYTTTHARMEDTSAYAVGNRGPIIPIAVDMTVYPFRWILTDADMGAVEAGYACQWCLEWLPEIWAPACTTCGMDRDLT